MSRAGVTSRPATQVSGRLPVLPAIQHPLSGMAPGPAHIDVIGSNQGSRTASGRPLAAEKDYRIPKRLSTAGSRQESRPTGKNMRQQTPLHDSIPEGIVITQGDPDKTRIPIFGNRSQLEERQDMVSRVSTRLSKASAESRLELDELESMIKDRCRTHFHEVQKKFKDNDPQGVGNVTKDALLRIIVMITGKPVNQALYMRLLQRIGFQERTVVHFSDFFSKFRDVPNSAYPQWMTSIAKNLENRPTLNAIQVHTLLKEKAKQRVLDVADLFPQTNPEGARRLLKPEFRNSLNKMMFAMNDEEFEKLWLKYDDENSGVIDGTKLMKKLGINVEESSVAVPSSPSPSLPASPEKPNTSPRKKEADRQRSLDIERWLKNKFREGFNTMKTSFEKCDQDEAGVVSAANFCSILSQHGLKLDRTHLNEFLSRCGISQSKLGVPYKDFLHRFQDRSEEGMPHRILGDPHHRYNKSIRSTSPSQISALSAIEAKLMNMFQRDFLSLIGTFHKIDRLGMDVISQEEFRAAIESRFNVEMTNDQFKNLVEQVPLTEDGDVKYAEFMAQFDTRGETESLFKQKGPQEAPVKQDKSGFDALVLEDEGRSRRDSDEITQIIKDLFSKDYKAVERIFMEMDEYQSQRMSQETLYQLLKKINVKPSISRGEIRDLWKSFITNKDGKLEWLQFVRHFCFTKSASFPNAKMNPPKRGDADYMVRSRKLNSDNDLLQDSLKQKIDYMWDALRKEFFAMDPYGTGLVSQEEFRDVLSELCVHLSEYEHNMLINKFKVKDGRVSYIEFLRPFAMRREIWRHGNNMQDLLAHPRHELPIADIVEPPQKGLVGITAKLRQKLAGDWKNLRRAFKKLDKTGEGLVTLPEFRNVLKLANVVLNEDEVYHVMNTFDEELSGKVNYSKFLSETFRPETKESQRK